MDARLSANLHAEIAKAARKTVNDAMLAQGFKVHAYAKKIAAPLLRAVLLTCNLSICCCAFDLPTGQECTNRL
jgi:hypothetical protein